MQHGPSMHLGFLKNLSTYEVALKSSKQIAEGTYAFVFDKPEGFRFKAGQHVSMTLIDPPETDAEGKSRFLTIASTPSEPDLVFAMRMRDTAFKRVLSRLQIGEKVIIQILLDSPHGSFVLREDASKPAVFIAGGIGIVPAYAMIKDALQRNLPHKLLLFYSNRRPEDAPFLSELQKLAKQNPAFQLIVTRTRTTDSAQPWPGESGHINRVMLEKYITDFGASIYYVAGLPAMVSATKTLLAESGVHSADIHAEEFTGFDLNKHHDATSPKRSYLPLFAIGVLIIILAIVHTGAIGSVLHAGLFKSFSLSNPVSYFAVGLLLALVAFKVYLVIRLKRTQHQGKLSMPDILKAHLPANKEK